MVLYNIFSFSMTRLDITRLINGSNKYTNYTLSYIISSDIEAEEVIIKVKDNIHSLHTNEIYIWENSKTNEFIWMDYVNKQATKSSIDLQFQQENSRLGNKYFVYLNDNNYLYSYKGKNNINGTSCVIAEFKNVNTGIWVDLWVDEQTGIVRKEVFYSIDEQGKKLEPSFIKEYSIVLNNVSNEDVEKPNLDGFEIY